MFGKYEYQSRVWSRWLKTIPILKKALLNLQWQILQRKNGLLDLVNKISCSDLSILSI